MKKRLHYILTRIFDTPLMIHRQKLETVLAVIRPRLPMMFEGDYPDGPVEEAVEEHTAIDLGGRIAVIPIHGILVHRATGMDAMCGMTDYSTLTEMVNQAAEDSSIEAILLDVDSPGGEAHGCFEFADAIFEARSKKPIVAIVNEMACSAAYAIASAAERIYVTKTSLTGSIGVIATHVDQSKADEMAGLKYTHIFAGKKKADWNEHEPLSERGKAAIQNQVTGIYNIFVTTVARNRGLDPEAIAGTEAGLFMGKSSVVAGLADEVIPLSALSEKLQETISMKQKTKPAVGAPAAAVAPTASTEELNTSLESTPPGEEEDDDEEEASVTPPAPVPAPAPAPDAIAIERARAGEISNMCTIAGVPSEALGFINSGLTVDQAKAQLFDKLAAGQATIINSVAPNASGDTESGEMLAASMKALNDRGRRPGRTQ